jgi:hypothetical protein
MASINYTVSMGDTTYGWSQADHVEPDVTIQGRDKSSPSDCALAILACIGNEAKVVSLAFLCFISISALQISPSKLIINKIFIYRKIYQESNAG